MKFATDILNPQGMSSSEIADPLTFSLPASQREIQMNAKL